MWKGGRSPSAVEHIIWSSQIMDDQELYQGANEAVMAGSLAR